MSSHKLFHLFLFLGGLALLVVTFSLWALQLRTLIYAAGGPPLDTVLGRELRVVSRLEGASSQIIQIDQSGEVVRVIYESSLLDEQTDFTLFAVPIDPYIGVIFVRPIADDSSERLVLYPLDLRTGQIGAATVSEEGVITFAISPNESIVGVILKGGEIKILQLASGELIETYKPSGMISSLTKPATSGSDLFWSTDRCLIVNNGTESETRYCLSE